MSARSSGNRPLVVLGLTAWVVLAFIGAQLIGSILYLAVAQAFPQLSALNVAVQTTLVVAISYTLAFCFAAFVPIPIGQKRPLIEMLGIARLPSWTDIGLSILAVLPYYILTAILLAAIALVIPAVNPTAPQELPFDDLVLRVEYIVAFVTLVVLAPLAEELFFRGYFMGKLRNITSTWFTIVFSSIIFGLMHLFAFGNGVTFQWAVAIDTFALGLVLAGLRIYTGSVWAGVLLHMIKNGIAYFFLFIYPAIGGTM